MDNQILAGKSGRTGRQREELHILNLPLPYRPYRLNGICINNNIEKKSDNLTSANPSALPSRANIYR